MVRFDREVEAWDTHVCGEPGRVIVGGVGDVPGESMFAKMRWLEDNDDALRRLMLREPRGYPASNCNLVLPPTRPEAAAGYVIMEQTEYPAMSGTNTIAVATVLLETGRVEAVEPVTELVLESPAGLIPVRATLDDGKVTGVTFENVPAFPVLLDAEIEVPELGAMRVDVAWGGMFYVIADAEPLGLRLTPEEAASAARAGEMIKAAAREQLPEPVHPDNPEIRGITIAQLSGPPHGAGAHRRNNVVVSTGRLDWERPESWRAALDRSPCGTGTCARMATLWARGQLPLEQDFVHEGVLGTTFTGRLLRETRVGDTPAVVPTLTGTGWITGHARYTLDPTDPFPEGFTVGDLWGGIEG